MDTKTISEVDKEYMLEKGLAHRFKCRSCGHEGLYLDFEPNDKGYVECEVCGLWTQVRGW